MHVPWFSLPTRVLSSSCPVRHFVNLHSSHFAAFPVPKWIAKVLPSVQLSWFPAVELMGGLMLLEICDRFQPCVFLLPGPHVFR